MSYFTTASPTPNLQTKNSSISEYDTPDDSPEDSKELKTLFLVIVLVLNLLGNTGVITTILHDRDLRSTPRNIFLGSLALSDILMTVVISFRIWTLHVCTVTIACVTFTTLFTAIIYVSILHLFTLSIDSYVAVFFPLRYRTIITAKRLAIVLTCAWLLPLITTASLPLFMKEQNRLHLQSMFFHCVGGSENNFDQSYKIITFVHATLLFIAPLVCMIVVYLKIAKVSWYQSNRVGALERGNAVYAGRSRAREMKWAKTIGKIILGVLGGKHNRPFV